MVDLSVVISAHNEEKVIERCLKSVRWAGEIIVIDSSSTDNTSNIAKQFTSKVFRQPNNLMLNINKNYGFTKATKKWVLSLDADEEVPLLLAVKIQQIIKGDRSVVVGYWIPRKNILFGKWIEHGLWWPDKQLRLFIRERGKFLCKHVHEYIEVDGPTDEFTEPYIHYNYQTISQFLQKMDTIYTESEVDTLQKSNHQLAWYDAIRFPISDFMKIYFAQEGYKDGLHGLVLSMLQAFYSFVVFCKFWEKRQFIQIDIPIVTLSKELDKAGKEMRYWKRTSAMQSSSNIVLKLWNRIVRKYVV